MKLVFSEQRTLEGKTYMVGTHSVDDELAERLLERFGRVVKKWRKPRKPRKPVAVKPKLVAAKPPAEPVIKPVITVQSKGKKKLE